jgi:hypothetical protein
LKGKVVETAKALGQILANELGITDAVNCFTQGNLAFCADTALTVLSSLLGGIAGRFAAKYGAPWKWDGTSRWVYSPECFRAGGCA